MKNDNLIKEGSVIISIKEYDHLRQFKKGILDNHVIKIYGYWDHFEIAVKTVDEQLQELNLINDNLGKKNIELKQSIEKLESKIYFDERTISELKSELEEVKNWRYKFWNWILGK